VPNHVPVGVFRFWELASRKVEPNPSGLSFLGLELDEKIVATVEIKLGTEPLNGEESDVFVRDRSRRALKSKKSSK
jgi:hypothetical protein